MGKTISLLPIFRTLVFFILGLSIESPTFFPCVSYAALLSSDKSTEEIVREYGNAVVSITAFDQDGKTLGEGSGFIVAPEGIVVTNYHCIEGADTAKARLTNGAYYDVEGVLGVDNDWDIAVLKVKAKNLPTAPLGDSDKLSVGERVVVIGNPLGLENTVSEGIISALRGREETGDALIQFTAPISPGSSGGPVFNKRGAVIGVTTLYLKEGQNLNFAVPINRAKPLLKNKNPIALAEATSPPVPALTEKDTNPEAQRHFNLGRSFVNEGQYDSAISEFQEAIRLKPDFAKAYAGLGLAYANKGLHDLAIRQFEEAIRLKPDFAGAYYNLGLSYAKKGLYDLAIRQYEEAIRLQPDSAEAYCALGNAYNKKVLCDLAIRQYEEAIRLKPDLAEAHLGLGVAYLGKGLNDLAIRHIEQAVRIKPDLKGVHELLDELYRQRGR